MFEVTWLLFIAASQALILTPGQDMILHRSRSIAQGRGAGIATAAGVSVGLVGHTLLATLGLGAILRTSEWLFLALESLAKLPRTSCCAAPYARRERSFREGSLLGREPNLMA